jgi:hypothetical protein
VIETSIVATIGPILGGRIFPDTAPFDTPKPWGTYIQVGGEATTFIDKAAPGIRNARIQINVWAATRAQANTVMQQIEAALVAATDMDARPLSAFSSLHEPDLSLYGAMQEFDCWKAT